MSSVAARSFGASASVMRATSPYLNAPPLAHSTTSPMACFLAVAKGRAGEPLAEPVEPGPCCRPAAIVVGGR